MNWTWYPGEVDAAAEAIKAKRRELIAQPLDRIYRQLAEAALTAAAYQRGEHIDQILTAVSSRISENDTGRPNKNKS